MKNKNIVVGVVICLIVAGASFYGGMKYGQNSKGSVSLNNRQGTFAQGGFNQNGMMGQQGGNKITGGRNTMNGGLVSGEILSKDDKSITVKLRDGGSKIVLFSAATQIEKTVDGVASDVSIGKQVTVIGTANADGTVSASSIQMRTTPVVSNQQ